jgi:cardiolipin synthase
MDTLTWTLLGALASAQRSVRVVTPYFLPDPHLASGLNLAALRGIQVDLVFPREVNLLPVQWAMWGQFWTVLGHGCRIWLTPPPFDHTKVMVVDEEWALFGSTNWDPRSLRLNFEFNVEAYDAELAQTLADMVDERIDTATRLDWAMLRQRSLPVRLRDGAARLFSPYL